MALCHSMYLEIPHYQVGLQRFFGYLETKQFKKTELGLQKQLKIDIKSATKFDFSLNIFIYFSNTRCFRFQFYNF